MTTIERVGLTAAAATGSAPYAPFAVRPGTVDLVASAQVLRGDTVDGVRWTGGFNTDEVECGPLPLFDVCTFDPADPAHHSVTTRKWLPYVVEAIVECSTFGSDTADLVSRARALLDSGAASASLEAEARTGALSTSAALANPTLEDGTALGSFGYLRALAELEQAARSTAPALGRYMIWANPRVVSLWASSQELRKAGSILVTAQDTVVASCGGFGNNDVAYVTGLPKVLLGDLTDSGPDDLMVDRANNTAVVRAARPAIVAWPTCLTAKVTVTLTDALAAA